MKNTSFTIDQIGKLREIEKKRIKSGESGLRGEVQELVKRLTSGGVCPKSDDPRIAQAKVLWDKGWGRELKIDSFDAYLAMIPEVPETLTSDDRFPELVLVDSRIGIVKTCELLSIYFGGNDQTFEDFDLKKTRAEKVYWMRAQDGKKNRNKSISTSRSAFASDELGLTVHEGLAFFVQNPETFRKWGMDLIGSVRCDRRDYAAWLGWFSGRPGLRWDFDGRGSPGYGSASRRE